MCRLRWSAALFVLTCAPPAAAQQGVLLLSATTQVLTGDELRLAGQNRLEPDLAVSWFQPAFRIGTFEFNTHLIQRDDHLRPGATVLGLRDVRVKGLSWSFQGGDAWVTPSITDYAFTNLFAPRLNLAGAVAQGQSQQTSITIAVGKSTALRTIFGTDTDPLDQGVAFAKVRHRASPAFEFSLRGSGVRTRDLGEFSWSIADSRQAGGGVRFRPIGLIEFVGDAAYTSFRRRGTNAYEQDVSALAGTLWTLPGGWVQINAERLSPGEFPVLHNSLTDRQGVFAAGEYDATRRLRVFGGVDGSLTNLDPEASAQGPAAPPRTRLVRAFGGVRTRVTQRSFLTLRVEDGSRESQPVASGRTSEADLSLVTAEWQATIGRWNTFARYARRSNIDLVNPTSTFVQHDATGQVYFSPTRSSQLFGSVQLQRRDNPAGAGLEYWQVSAGGQVQVPARNLWLRAEGTATNTHDLTADLLTERQALTVGFFGQLTSRTQIAFDLYVDRAPSALLSSNPYTTRSTIRLVHSIPTGSARVATAAATGTTVGRSLARGTGTIAGVVFADWNGNGTRDPGEEPVSGIALAVGSLASVSSGTDGQFRFTQVPAGLQQVGLDVTALPVDYDVSLVARVEIDIERNKTAQVSFGLIPLGSVAGGVYRDANADGRLDEADEPIDGAVLVMDEGARSELARGGAFRFDAVRAGRHVIRLLADSLPTGAEIQGPAEAVVELARGSMAARPTFLVKLEKRPEIRKVFPPSSVAATPARPGRPAPPPPRPVVPTPAPARPAPATPPAPESRSASAMAGPVSIQLAAVGRLERAQSLVEDLRSRGFDAYIVQPAPGRADGFYRVRIGAYATRDLAQQAIAVLHDALDLPAVVAADQPSSAVPFRIQVAAVREADQARVLVQRLSQAGYPAYVISPGPGASDPLYRVRVGTYGTREDARRAADAIEKELGARVWITQDQAPPRPPSARRAPGSTATPAPAAGPFVLQVAAFSDETRAQAAAARIRELGLTPVVLPPQAGSPDALFRVRVGGFSTRDAAASAAEQLEMVFGTRPWIVPAGPGGRPPVVAPAPTTNLTQAPAGTFVVQIAAMADPERVRALVDRLRELGYRTYVSAPSLDSTDAIQRVGVGPFPTIEEARAAAVAIEAALGLKGWVRSATAR